MAVAHVYTYTHTLTKQERTISELNKKVYKEIKKSFTGEKDSKYPYVALSEDGSFLEEKPMNLYEEGVLIGDDFCIYKSEGLVESPGTDIHYAYISEDGEIHSFGSDYGRCFVLLPGDIKITITEFNNHPEVEEFLDTVSKKINEEEEQKGNQLQ